jgi:imidazolonepropionase-like amidohydrolase
VVVIDGDPLKDLRELAKVTMVIKNGWWVDPAELRRMVSLRPPE